MGHHHHHRRRLHPAPDARISATAAQITLIVPGLRVRNYTPIETDTPTPLPPSATSGPGTAAAAQPYPEHDPHPSATPLPPTPTPLPTNPAIISPGGCAHHHRMKAPGSALAYWPCWAPLSASASGCAAAHEITMLPMNDDPAHPSHPAALHIRDLSSSPAWAIRANGYTTNRHNVGFMVVNQLAETPGRAASTAWNSSALVAKALYQGQRLILAKPQTYMNGSGNAVRSLLRFYKIPPQKLAGCRTMMWICPWGRCASAPRAAQAGKRACSRSLSSSAVKIFPACGLASTARPGAWKPPIMCCRTSAKNETELLDLTLEPGGRCHPDLRHRRPG